MTRHLIDVGGRASVSPDHIKMISWRANAKPFTDHATGAECLASVTIETYHESYRIPFATADEARAAYDALAAACSVDTSADALSQASERMRSAARGSGDAAKLDNMPFMRRGLR